jgi:hypothetical protein
MASIAPCGASRIVRVADLVVKGLPAAPGTLRQAIQFHQANRGGLARHPGYQAHPANRVAQVALQRKGVLPAAIEANKRYQTPWNVRPPGDYRDITGQTMLRG